MPVDNKELMRRFYDRIINEGDLAVVDDVLDPDYEDESSVPLELPGPAGFKRRIEELRRSFTLRIELHDMVGERDLVAFRWTITGEHVGEFGGVAPTHRRVTLRGLNLERVLDGRITQHWSEFDPDALMKQVASD
jgi:predicted ester cyclase